MNYLPWLILLGLFGMCVGSFLNVVIFRLPAGQSLVTPPSTCPKCGQGIRWYDNIPVLSWMLLRGRCRFCATSISPQYPMIEALTGVLFAGLAWVYYVADWPISFADLQPLPELVGFAARLPRFDTLLATETYPVLLLHLVLIAALIAASKIDARLFIIPLQIPWLVTGIALGAKPAIAMFEPVTTALMWRTDGPWLGAGVGAMVGLAASLVMLWKGIVPRSFADEQQVMEQLAAKLAAEGESASPPSPKPPASKPTKPRAIWPMYLIVVIAAATLSLWGWVGIAAAVAVLWSGVVLIEPDADGEAESDAGTDSADEPGAWLAYPHPRREMFKELLFLLPVILGGVIGYVAGQSLLDPATTTLPPAAQAFGGALIGYFVGAGMIWGTRIVFTLLFGKEAMGLGDVHLLAAVGAVAGPVVCVLGFFIAPFIGLSYVIVSLGAATMVKQRFKPIPYGPHLAAGAIIAMAFGDLILLRLFSGIL